MKELNTERINKAISELKKLFKQTNTQYTDIIYMKKGQEYELQYLNANTRTYNTGTFTAPENCFLITDQESTYKNNELIINEIVKFAIPFREE